MGETNGKIKQTTILADGADQFQLSQRKFIIFNYVYIYNSNSNSHTAPLCTE